MRTIVRSKNYNGIVRYSQIVDLFYNFPHLPVQDAHHGRKCRMTFFLGAIAPNFIPWAVVFTLVFFFRYIFSPKPFQFLLWGHQFRMGYYGRHIGKKWSVLILLNKRQGPTMNKTRGIYPFFLARILRQH